MHLPILADKAEPGDNDGILDPGENALLQVTAQNTAFTDATGCLLQHCQPQLQE